jgi:glutamate-ammonia-ligase adenylyltransferase
MVQYLVLSYSNKHAQLTDNYGNIALLKTLAKLDIIDKNLAEQVANAYREYRTLIHASKLQEKPATVQLAQIAQHQQSVVALWNAVF